MVGMVAQAELNADKLEEVVDLVPTCKELHEEGGADCANLGRIQEDMAELLAAWRARQAEKHAQHLELQQKVAAAQQRLLSAQTEGTNREELAHARDQLAQAQARESQMEADVKSLEECIEGLEDQMAEIKLQKESMEQPDTDEAFLKNELSLFLNVSSILPDLSDPKFSGTFVDKQKGVKTFKFSAEDMSPFETCKAAWDMMM